MSKNEQAWKGNRLVGGGGLPRFSTYARSIGKAPHPFSKGKRHVGGFAEVHHVPPMEEHAESQQSVPPHLSHPFWSPSTMAEELQMGGGWGCLRHLLLRAPWKFAPALPEAAYLLEISGNCYSSVTSYLVFSRSDSTLGNSVVSLQDLALISC